MTPPPHPLLPPPFNPSISHATLKCPLHDCRQPTETSPQYPSHRQSTESAQLAEYPSYRQPMDPAQPDPYVTPPHYREAGPSLDGGPSPVRLLSYPPLQQVERRRSASNTDMGTRRAFAANLQMVEPYSNEVHRPTYTQRSAAVLFRPQQEAYVASPFSVIPC